MLKLIHRIIDSRIFPVLFWLCYGIFFCFIVLCGMIGGAMAGASLAVQKARQLIAEVRKAIRQADEGGDLNDQD